MLHAKLTTSLLFVFCLFAVPQFAGATAYYIDFECGTGGTHSACSALGTATTTPFGSLDDFTESARAAGDIAFVRRGTASTTNVSQLDFTSDGTFVAPLTITADYDNLWNDFATSSQTYTVAIATSTFTANANITGISAGNWVYVEGDCGETYNASSYNTCEFAYEVLSVSGTQLTFYLPYKGNQSNSGLRLRVLPANPIWGTAAGAPSWAPNTDHFWLVKGLDIRSTAVTGQVQFQTSNGWTFVDTIFIGNGASDVGLSCSSSTLSCAINIAKARVINNNTGFLAFSGFVGQHGTIIKDSFISAGTPLFSTIGVGAVVVSDSYINTAQPYGSFGAASNLPARDIYYRNVIGNTFTNLTSFNFDVLHIEDDNGQVGVNNVRSDVGNSNSPFLQSTTSVLRAGGGPTSIFLAPSTNLTPLYPARNALLFEYPIYSDTSSKQFDVYFHSTSTANWTANPTASELWIECDYWAHDTNATSTRKVKKSTGTVDLDGSTSWQALSVTCDPSQSGILYLRAWYAKTKEAGASNWFYVDGTPIITP